MAKVTKKWIKEYAKRYTDALNQIRDLDKELQELKDKGIDNEYASSSE